MFTSKPKILIHPKFGSCPNHKRWEDQSAVLVKHLTLIKTNIDNFHLKDLWKLKTAINELTVTRRNPEQLNKLKTEYDSKKDKLISETQDEKFVAKLTEKLHKTEASSLSLEEVFIKTQCNIYLACQQNYQVLKKENKNLIELNACLHKVVSLTNYSCVSQGNLTGLNALYAEFHGAISAFTSTTQLRSTTHLMDSKYDVSFAKDICPKPSFPEIYDAKSDTVKGSSTLLQQLENFLQNHFSPIFLAYNLYPWLCAQALKTHQKLQTLKVIIKQNSALCSTTLFNPIPIQNTHMTDFQYLKQLENWAETCILIVKRKVAFINKKNELTKGVHNLFCDILHLYASASNNSTALRPFVGVVLQRKHLQILESWLTHETRERNKEMLMALQSLLTLFFTIQESKHYLAFDFPEIFKVPDLQGDEDQLNSVTNWANKTTQKLGTVAPTLVALNNKFNSLTPEEKLLRESRARLANAKIDKVKGYCPDNKVGLPPAKAPAQPLDEHYFPTPSPANNSGLTTPLLTKNK